MLKMNSNKGRLAVFGAALTVAGGVVGLTAVSQQSASAQMRPPIIVRPNGHGERHPEMRMAMQHLEEARANLAQGAHDFNGNRQRALDLTNQAIAACQAALASDRH